MHLRNELKKDIRRLNILTDGMHDAMGKYEAMKPIIKPKDEFDIFLEAIEDQRNAALDILEKFRSKQISELSGFNRDVIIHLLQLTHEDFKDNVHFEIYHSFYEDKLKLKKVKPNETTII